MEHYNVVLSIEARADMREIVRYIAKELREPLTEEKMLDLFDEAVLSLEILPERYALAADGYLAAQGIRMLTVGNYLIFYIVNRGKKTVDIFRILYGRRNWMSILRTQI